MFTYDTQNLTHVQPLLCARYQDQLHYLQGPVQNENVGTINGLKKS